MAPVRPVVNTIPSQDVVLRRVVDRVTADHPPASAADLAGSLRPMYPRVAVFERQLSGERSHLYVYRNGRYEPPRSEQWWNEPGVPCVHIARETGVVSAVTGAWAELMRAQEADLVGRHFLDFVQPEARPVAMAMFDALAEAGEVRSEALVVRPDGSTLAIEFRAVRREGGIEVCYRPLED